MSDAVAAEQIATELKPPHKKLIICMDGTWNEPEEASEYSKYKEEPTNVVKIVRGIKPRDANNVVQIAYYHTGVGTGPGPYDKWIGGALGVGLSRDVREAYRFIANNYIDGDRLYIFGFSRGAFAARALAAFIGCVGLLDKKHLAWLPEAYKIYRTHPDQRENSNEERLFRKLNINRIKGVPIHFVGVWDTVGALGAPTPILKRLTKRWVGFHDTSLGVDVKHAYHALAVDERRKPFMPDLWTAQAREEQIVEQVWFAGVHSNIGGGYQKTVLSDIALKWMVERAAECGLDFKKHLSELNPKPIEKGRVENSFSFIYKALGPYNREIGNNQFGRQRKQPGVNEWVHWTALEALTLGHSIDFSKGSNEEYGPKNLRQAHKDGLPEWKEHQKGRVWNYQNR